ncbi:MAG TPA: hypothetical protein VFJ91_10105 [Gaiellaceae bacterium]|jgi:hypothetical protein|nr:hypothetical protein [Gaiellaceae bacterium]
MRYEVLVDGERQARLQGEDELRRWLRGYRAEHVEDDPDAAHVQLRRLSPFAWLTGGALVDRDRFLDDEPLHAVEE